jgi:hypothetical protein
MFLPLSFSRLFYKNHHGVDWSHSVCLPKQQISARRWRARREGVYPRAVIAICTKSGSSLRPKRRKPVLRMIILDCFALLAMTNDADYMHGALITKNPLRGFA